MLPALAWTQETAPSQESRFVSPGLAPGDALTVRMFDFPETQGGVTVHVSPDGNIILPYAGTLNVLGMSPADLQGAISASLRDRGMVKQPNVTVDIVSAVNFSVTVQGQVQTPKTLPLLAPAPISYVIAQVGGLTGLASHRLTILHHGDAMPTSVDFNTQAPNGAAMNTLIVPGDIVSVSYRGVYFVGGEVGHPGIYPLGGVISVGQASPVSGEGVVEHITLLQALAQAGGITPIAARSKLHILRTENGKRVDINVDQVKLSNGEVADPILQPDDIIYIPPSYLRQQTNNLFATALSSLYAVTSIKGANF